MSEDKSEDEYENRKYPVYYTDGNGIVREVRGVFIFIKKPGCLIFSPGDKVPRGWKLKPANQLAKENHYDTVP